MEIGNERTVLPGKITTRIARGTLIIHEQAGAGGFGDPLLRDPDEVREDLIDGKITTAYALDHHGVVFGSHGVLDTGATAKLRSERAAVSSAGGRDGA